MHACVQSRACIRAVTCTHRPIDPTTLYHQQQHMPPLLPPLHFINIKIMSTVRSPPPFHFIIMPTVLTTTTPSTRSIQPAHGTQSKRSKNNVMHRSRPTGFPCAVPDTAPGTAWTGVVDVCSTHAYAAVWWYVQAAHAGSAPAQHVKHSTHTHTHTHTHNTTHTDTHVRHAVMTWSCA